MGNKDTALVVGVGASHGLGAAAARRFAREGLHVVVAGRTAEKVECVAEEISASGGSAEAVTGDAAIEENAIRFVETAEAKGPLAIVLQNSGSNRQDPFLELAAADFETIWREHCLAGFLTGRESARRMVPRGYVARHCTRRLGPRRRDCELFRKAWRVSSALWESTSPMSSSTEEYRATGSSRASPMPRRHAAPTACCQSMQSQRRIGNCTCSIAVPGLSNKTFAHGPRNSELWLEVTQRIQPARHACQTARSG